MTAKELLELFDKAINLLEEKNRRQDTEFKEFNERLAEERRVSLQNQTSLI